MESTLTNRETRMGWHWQGEQAGGAPVSNEAQRLVVTDFPSQADAESWIGEQWRQLLDAGVDQVRLFEDDREVYGPMSLHPAAEV